MPVNSLWVLGGGHFESAARPSTPQELPYCSRSPNHANLHMQGERRCPWPRQLHNKATTACTVAGPVGHDLVVGFEIWSAKKHCCDDWTLAAQETRIMAPMSTRWHNYFISPCTAQIVALLPAQRKHSCACAPCTLHPAERTNVAEQCAFRMCSSR